MPTYHFDSILDNPKVHVTRMKSHFLCLEWMLAFTLQLIYWYPKLRLLIMNISFNFYCKYSCPQTLKLVFVSNAFLQLTVCCSSWSLSLRVRVQKQSWDLSGYPCCCSGRWSQKATLRAFCIEILFSSSETLPFLDIYPLVLLADMWWGAECLALLVFKLDASLDCKCTFCIEPLNVLQLQCSAVSFCWWFGIVDALVSQSIDTMFFLLSSSTVTVCVWTLMMPYGPVLLSSIFVYAQGDSVCVSTRCWGRRKTVSG